MIPGDKVTIAGVPVTIASEEECELADFVVCGPPGDYPWTDNVETQCAHCRTPIVHRPHAPKRPLKICMSCAADSMGATTQ